MSPEHLSLIEDLTVCYYSILRHSPNLTRMEVCRLIAKSSAPRFYVSPSYARRIIRDITIGKPRATCSRAAEEHRELYHRWQLLDDKSPESLQQLLNSPAPSFYLSAHRINKLLYKYYDRRK